MPGREIMRRAEARRAGLPAPATHTGDAPARPELVAAAREYMDAARSKRTREAYSWAWAGFTAWCAREGREALPASPETVALWMAAIARGDGDRVLGDMIIA
jgi:hypothetical protein